MDGQDQAALAMPTPPPTGRHRPTRTTHRRPAEPPRHRASAAPRSPYAREQAMPLDGARSPLTRPYPATATSRAAQRGRGLRTRRRVRTRTATARATPGIAGAVGVSLPTRALAAEPEPGFRSPHRVVGRHAHCRDHAPRDSGVPGVRHFVCECPCHREGPA
ncbi:hypothetical protein [Streptomyces sp. WAC08241]|uniref:hypothetical protein n=1 Tax=Streptomyces sp. WAC08241 TaxID=2487421 RepID=UPI0021B01781|nr:hypothetical protein [Streptomyces sp. WAC08241]